MLQTIGICKETKQREEERGASATQSGMPLNKNVEVLGITKLYT